jgi:hypothetical protein
MRTLARLTVGLFFAAAFPLAARAEIQTLYRGECYTPTEGAAKLAEFGARYQTGDQWQARATAIRQGVRRGLKLETLPPPCELKPIRLGALKGNGYTVESIAFESLPGFWVTGNLYLPEKIDGKVPGVLCPHGHSTEGRLGADAQARCQALARMGAVVLAYDMVGFNESKPVPHRHSETARLQTYNSMRCVDFLLSLGAVDETRLAVTGESGGGTQSFLLACVDDRIDASVPVVMVSSYFYGGCMCESGMPIHKIGEHETNNVEIAATFAPKPQLVISDGGDWTQHVPEIEFPYLQRVYRLCGAEANVENAHFAQEGHDYGPSKRAAMYQFLAKHLKLDLSAVAGSTGEIDDSFVRVQPPSDLLVFPPDHPRPEHAVADAEAVIAALDHRE